MKVNYVAFDSLGVKSSCVLIETDFINICIDPGIAGERSSFPLSAKERTYLRLKYEKKIKKACKKADIIVLTHYHYDHHIPKKELYIGKLLLIKDPLININKSQRERAKDFLELIQGKVKEIEVADGRDFEFGSIKINFSEALWHGIEGTRLGKVVMTIIDDGKQKVLHSSDINGPYIKEYAKKIVEENPDLIILDGFPSYILGFIASYENFKKVLENTIYILENSKAKIILDHHLLRDYRYKELYYEVFKRAKELRKEIHTAAEELGKVPKVLEGFEKNGPTRWKNWTNFTFDYLSKIIKHAKEVGKKQKKRKKKLD